MEEGKKEYTKVKNIEGMKKGEKEYTKVKKNIKEWRKERKNTRKWKKLRNEEGRERIQECKRKINIRISVIARLEAEYCVNCKIRPLL